MYWADTGKPPDLGYVSSTSHRLWVSRGIPVTGTRMSCGDNPLAITFLTSFTNLCLFIDQSHLPWIPGLRTALPSGWLRQPPSAIRWGLGPRGAGTVPPSPQPLQYAQRNKERGGERGEERGTAWCGIPDSSSVPLSHKASSFHPSQGWFGPMKNTLLMEASSSLVSATWNLSVLMSTFYLF